MCSLFFGWGNFLHHFERRNGIINFMWNLRIVFLILSFYPSTWEHGLCLRKGVGLRNLPFESIPLDEFSRISLFDISELNPRDFTICYFSNTFVFILHSKLQFYDCKINFQIDFCFFLGKEIN